MSQHTPGPWFASEVTGDEEPCYISAHRWESLAKVYGNEEADFAQEGRANARLIAAAPELLEALHLMVEALQPAEVDFVDYERIAMEKARAAIKKARGE